MTAPRSAAMTPTPCLRAVERWPRMVSHACAPVVERWGPEIFSWVLAGRRSLSPWLLVNRQVRSTEKRSTSARRRVRRSSRLRVLDCLRPGARGLFARPARTAWSHRWV